MISKNLFLKTIFAASLFAVTALLRAQSAVTISVDAQHPGPQISPDFIGLSFELSQLLPDGNGVRYFRPDNQPLIELFHTLGIKSLRVGGNTADRNVRRLPDTTDIDSLFAFAKAADVKVIYCLRLHNGNPEEDARVAKYILDRYPEQIAYFSIGQEPNVYPKVTNSVAGTHRMKAARPSYADYAKRWKRFESVIVAAAPDARFCGPSVDSNPVWPRQFMDDFGQGDHVGLITAHFYPGHSGDRVPSPEIGRDEMLSAGFLTAYQKLYNGFVPEAKADGFPYRLEEVNNFFNGGARDVSDTFASALWGLDFMYWWAEHGAAGLNFHTGDRVAAGAELRPSKYTAYFTAPEGLQVRPLGYGIKAFDVGGHGEFLPAKISNPGNLNLSVYCVLRNEDDVYVTLINKEHGANARAADVSIEANNGFTKAQTLPLVIPNGDIAAKTGMTLGGAPINDNGTWNGNWTTLSPAKEGLISVKVPAGSAMIVRLSE